MEDKGLAPDLVTYSTMIKVYERSGEWQRALEVCLCVLIDCRVSFDECRALLK